MDQDVDHVWERRLAIAPAPEHVKRLLGASLLLGRERALQRCCGDRVEEVELTLRACARGERVQANGASGREGDRLYAERLGESVVLALDVDDPGLAAEDALPKDVRLHEARFRPADDADDDCVWTRQLAAVQLPGVVTERAAVDIAPDVNAPTAEAAFGYEGIR